MRIRKDAHGLYIRSRYYSIDRSSTAYRPGNFVGYSHAWNTQANGLCEGDNVKTSHVNGEPFVKITMSNGDTVYWGSYNRDGGDFPETTS